MRDSVAPADVNWVLEPIIKMHDNPPPDSQWEYKVWLPDWLAEWDVFGDWEVEQFNSMRDNLKKGDVLFDIGAELGWQSIIYAQFVGAENMVLVEPSAAMWPNIAETWEKNYPDIPPLACHYGLFSDKTTGDVILPKHVFPSEALGKLVRRVSYKYIHEHGRKVPQLTIDDYVKITGIVPDALTMDTEGSEYLILQGAEKTLKDNDLKVWVSVHPELALTDYGILTGQVLDFMGNCGYKGELLVVDHEHHYYFRKVEV